MKESQEEEMENFKTEQEEKLEENSKKTEEF